MFTVHFNKVFGCFQSCFLRVSDLPRDPLLAAVHLTLKKKSAEWKKKRADGWCRDSEEEEQASGMKEEKAGARFHPLF